ncbi:ROK family protein [Agrococcus beijingensis]|uniref:ROK family protein n=1 Tax=Agrococcus beijingensis TaxID=3068634 RepID=UPI00274174F3|nr:ROK family protein [Agrococcus sp. REN33]
MTDGRHGDGSLGDRSLGDGRHGDGSLGDAVLAVDIGGTKTAVALLDGEHAVLAMAQAPTPGADGPDAIIGTVVALAQQVVERAPGARVVATGVGTAGTVDVDRGAIVWATETLADWAGTPLAASLRSRLAPLVGDAPVQVQNDVDAHALGELRRGAAAGARSALMVAVGTGIGASVIVDGRVLRGHRHVAGAFAHVPVGAAGLRCTCGRVGHLEAIGGGLGLHRHYLALGGDRSVADARGVAGRAPHDPIARRAVADSAAAVGRAIAGAATLLDPELVVLSGGVVAAGAVWWAPMESALRTELIEVLHDLPVVAGSLGGAAPLHGAAAAAWEMVGA